VRLSLTVWEAAWLKATLHQLAIREDTAVCRRILAKLRPADAEGADEDVQSRARLFYRVERPDQTDGWTDDVLWAACVQRALDERTR